MKKQIKSLHSLSFHQMDMELLARGAQDPGVEPFFVDGSAGTHERDLFFEKLRALYSSTSIPKPDAALAHISTLALVKRIVLKIREEEKKASRASGKRMDVFQLNHQAIKQNTQAVAAICMRRNLNYQKNGLAQLQIKNYGRAFNLDQFEPYRNQPIAAGRFCTGFLVSNDIIATAGHCADKGNVEDLRILFGFQMEDSKTAITQVPESHVYKGAKIIDRVYDPKGTGADWALVKLDRKVTDQTIVKLANKDIKAGDLVYVLGHPCGLPLKFVPGSPVCSVSDTYFSADLTVYSGNSGSPVFSHDTHEVVGIVVRGDKQDFRWTGRGWLSIRYPNSRLKSMEPQCTKVSEFRDFVFDASGGQGEAPPGPPITLRVKDEN
jgi:hypothetical protein